MNVTIMQQIIRINKWQSATGQKKLKIELNFYFPKVISEFASLEGLSYEGHNVWTCKDNLRNQFTFDILSGGQFNGQSKFYSKNGQHIFANPGWPLWQHQLISFENKIKKRRMIDAGEMGIGKTLSTIAAIDYWRNGLKWTESIWWIGPNSGLTALRTQLKKFNAEKLFVAGYTGRDKIINYHSLERTMEDADSPPQILILDELHNLKNPSARRTQLAIALSEAMNEKYGNECAVIGLTGTPAPENHFDWWAPCEVICPGWLKESTYNKYKWRLANFSTGTRSDGGSFPKFEGWKSREVELLPKRLDGLVLVTWKKDCLDLPAKIYEERQLEISESTKRVAKAIARSGKRAIEIQSRLRQLSDGFQYPEYPESQSENFEDKVEIGINETRFGETPKDQALKEILEEYQECGRVVIYAAFTASVDRCAKIALEEGWIVWLYDGRGQNTYFPTQALCQDFGHCFVNETIFQDINNHSKIAFVGNPEAAGQGLTLTPSPVIVYYSNSFKSQFRVQSEDRIHRPGASKERGCKIIDLLHLPTDKLVLDKIKNKRSVEEITLNEIESLFI